MKMYESSPLTAIVFSVTKIPFALADITDSQPVTARGHDIPLLLARSPFKGIRRLNSLASHIIDKC